MFNFPQSTEHRVAMENMPNWWTDVSAAWDLLRMMMADETRLRTPGEISGVSMVAKLLTICTV